MKPKSRSSSSGSSDSNTTPNKKPVPVKQPSKKSTSSEKSSSSESKSPSKSPSKLTKEIKDPEIIRIEKDIQFFLNEFNSLEQQAELYGTKLPPETETHITEGRKSIETLQIRLKVLQSTKSKLTEHIGERSRLESKLKELKAKKPPEPQNEKVFEEAIIKTQNLIIEAQEEVTRLLQDTKETKDLIIEYMDKSKVSFSKVVTNIVNKKIIQNELAAENLDLCVLMDFTGTMGKYIKMVSKKIKDILENTKSKFKEANIRVAVVGYRDYGDYHLRHESIPLGDVNLMIDFLEDVDPKGGDDIPEDVNGGFQKALALAWDEKAAKVMIHIGDAPCHGSDFHKIERDNFPNGGDDDRPWKDLFDKMLDKEILYTFLKISNDTDLMIQQFEKIFNEIAPEDMKGYFSWQEIGKDENDMANTIINSAKSAISRSIASSYSNLKSSGNGPTTEYLEPVDDEDTQDDGDPLQLLTTIEKAPPYWTTPSFTQSRKCHIIFLWSLKALKLLNSRLNVFQHRATIEVNPKPFDKGTFSLAYYCKVRVDELKNVEFQMVLKKPKHSQKQQYYHSGLKKNILVSFLANEYNKALEKASIPEKERIFFVKTLYVKAGPDAFFLEAYIPGVFEKYTNNKDFVNENVPLMTAFSHFSYQYSDEQYMVTDLQGVNHLLTDPAVHSSVAEFYEHGDCGSEGMAVFFRRHECNKYCKALGLKEHDSQKDRKIDIKRIATKFNLESLYVKCACFYCNGNAVNSTDEGLCEYCSKNGVNLDPGL